MARKTELISEGNGQARSEREPISTGMAPPRDAIGFKDCPFSWDASTAQVSPAKRHMRKHFNLRFDGEVMFYHGKVNIIVGPTASGKVRSRLPIHALFDHGTYCHRHQC